jgi:2'-5' RNA ligase
MLHQFSIAICPPQEFVNEIALMKKELSEKIGWFNSKNSDAHITINVFSADEKELLIWKTYLLDFCRSQHSFEIRFTKTGTFPHNGAFYLEPDPVSKELLLNMMKDFHQHAPVKTDKISLDPHLSIARRLKPKEMDIAFQLWSDKIFDLKFTCDNLTVRKFSSSIKQYSIESRHFFSMS